MISIFYFSFRKEILSEDMVWYHQSFIDGFCFPLSSVLSPNPFVSPSLGILYSISNVNISAYFDTKVIMGEKDTKKSKKKKHGNGGVLSENAPKSTPSLQLD